ncbi:nucleolar complex protein 2 homolog [Chelonus insularis]|uniref:nucleolar complex protein 2 homolog n=1 Tax=Chelonus insularis TaxID=460826 RepID=UPI00158BE0CB|nr:nucleolar complex protein 2 homolog [Chelonus insularis]
MKGIVKNKVVKKKGVSKIKKKLPAKKKNLADTSIDEFFNQDFELEENNESKTKKRSKKDESESEESDVDIESHKKSLKSLKDVDPEFYQFLQKNDKKLLDFNLSDDEKASDDEEDHEDKHVPPSSLEVPSDESDYEQTEVVENEASQGPIKITFKLLDHWRDEIQKDKSIKTIKKLVDAFHAALITVSDPDASTQVQYKIEGGALFNAVVQLCILSLPDALKKFLKISSEAEFEAHKSKRFPKIRSVLKTYLKDLLELLQHLTSPEILRVLLKHLHALIRFTRSFSSLNKLLIRILLKLWSTGEESVRVIAFLNIYQLAKTREESLLETLLKSMYLKYVENAKFVAPSTLPGINFMRCSLVEIYLLDSNYAYNYVFLYVRQLAIYLRNAMTLKKKEHFQAVYNWQFINALRFWCDLIISSKNNQMIQSLQYPLVQIITGTIQMIPTSQFYPLRFHCTQMLIKISKETGTFIPVLPYLLEVLNNYDFNKKHTAVSMKPLSFICILRVSKSQLRENGFKDAVIESIYELMLETAAKDSHFCHFPDMYVPCIIQLKHFLKKCKVTNFCKKIKQLLSKIQENAQFIETERKKITVDLKDLASIKNWENTIKNQGTPLIKFYKSWFEIHQSQKLKLLTQNDSMSDLKLPVIKKSNKKRNNNDSDNSDLDMTEEQLKAMDKKQKAQKKKKRKVVHENKNGGDFSIDNNVDIVEDMTLNDWK